VLDLRRLKLISWNTNRRRHAARDQVAVLLQRHPDFVALQEVTAKSKAILAEGLRKGGLEHVAFSMDGASTVPSGGARSFGVLIASRRPDPTSVERRLAGEAGGRDGACRVASSRRQLH
jgi:exonuclease III